MSLAFHPEMQGISTNIKDLLGKLLAPNYKTNLFLGTVRSYGERQLLGHFLHPVEV